ncbi:MAG: hypothetical protein ACLFQQ_13120 [Desulfococcaceae bacterium]
MIIFVDKADGFIFPCDQIENPKDFQEQLEKLRFNFMGRNRNA